MDAPAADRLEAPVEPGDFRRVMGRFASGVTVITAVHDGAVRGMTANAFMSGSLQPPLCVVAIARRAHMCGVVRGSRRFAVNVLAHDQADVAMHFSGRPVPTLPIAFDWVRGLPLLSNAAAQMAAAVEAEHGCGDHALFVGRLFHLAADDARQPLLYHAGRFAALVATGGAGDVAVPEFW